MCSVNELRDNVLNLFPTFSLYGTVGSVGTWRVVRIIWAIDCLFILCLESFYYEMNPML